MAEPKNTDALDKLLKHADSIAPPEQLAALHASAGAALSKQLFFVCGALKSGTTWLQLMLDAHPEIACRGEGHLVNILLPGLGKALQKYNSQIGFKNKNFFNEIEGYPRFRRSELHALFQFAAALLLSQYDRQDIRFIGEKSPDSILYLPLLGEIFAEARFVHIIRDGRDGAVSGWFHNLRVSKEWAENQFGDFAGFAEHYAKVWTRALNAGRKFGAQNPERYHEVRYEDLLSGGEAELQGILKFLGARIDAAEIVHCLEASSFSTVTKGRAAGEEDRQSHFRKGIHGDWRAHFDADIIAAFRSHAGKHLDALGYGD